jgi:hypothetical protein
MRFRKHLDRKRSRSEHEIVTPRREVGESGAKEILNRAACVFHACPFDVELDYQPIALRPGAWVCLHRAPVLEPPVHLSPAGARLERTRGGRRFDLDVARPGVATFDLPSTNSLRGRSFGVSRPVSRVTATKSGQHEQPENRGPRQHTCSLSRAALGHSS